MAKKETNKYLIPVELTEYTPNKWLGVKTYEYKLYSDASESKCSRIRFIDFNGFIIGEHMPTKLHTVYDKAALEAKKVTVKAVTEIKNVVDGVADIAVDVVSEVKGDVSKTAGIAVGLFGKIKSIAKNRFKREDTNIDKDNTTSPGA